jgi:hypothetical protein
VAQKNMPNYYLKLESLKFKRQGRNISRSL